jgi:hypothetical protein
MIELFGRIDGEQFLAAGKKAAFAKIESFDDYRTDLASKSRRS